MNRLVRTWFALYMLGLCLPLAGCGPLPERFGILAKEAGQGASLDDLTSALSALLEAREADTFAGLWIQEQPTYRVFVAFTRDGQETIKRYVAGTPLDGMVEVRKARFTYAELLAAGQEVGQLAQELGFPFSSVGDVQGNCVDLWVTDRAGFEAALKAAHRKLPDPVEIVEAYVPLGTAPAGLTPVPGVAIPQIRAHTVEDLLLDLPGQLVVKDGCLRIIPRGEEAGYLIIWQPDYFLNDNQGTLEVWDRDGNVVARVGQEITLGLAGLPGDSQVEAFLREHLPAQCPGPVWLMSRVVPKP